MKFIKLICVILIFSLIAGCAFHTSAPTPTTSPAPTLGPLPTPVASPTTAPTLPPLPTPAPQCGAKAKPVTQVEANYAVIKVFYATDRKKTDATKPSQVFSSGRGVLTYGICEVSIPRHHIIGELEAPSIWRLEFREDTEKHVVLLSVVPKEKGEYFSDVAKRVKESSGKKLFIFVHGYKVTFKDAARRTAQMSYDLGFDGAPVFYSWPSQGNLGGYLEDETNIEWTENHLIDFISDVVERTDAENIYLIAHSMGNRAMTRALGEFISKKPELRKRFREIILTAPDIDADVFKNKIAPQIIGVTSITLYTSSKDKALIASKKIHGYPRVGDTSDGIVLIPGIDTIDATNVDTSFIGHLYFAERRSVLSDIYQLLEGKRPKQRFGLMEVITPSGNYWMFKE